MAGTAGNPLAWAALMQALQHCGALAAIRGALAEQLPPALNSRLPPDVRRAAIGALSLFNGREGTFLVVTGALWRLPDNEWLAASCSCHSNGLGSECLAVRFFGTRGPRLCRAAKLAAPLGGNGGRGATSEAAADIAGGARTPSDVFPPCKSQSRSSMPMIRKCKHTGHFGGQQLIFLITKKKF
jgi:hypothetical protein